MNSKFIPYVGALIPGIVLHGAALCLHRFAEPLAIAGTAALLIAAMASLPRLVLPQINASMMVFIMLWGYTVRLGGILVVFLLSTANHSASQVTVIAVVAAIVLAALAESALAMRCSSEQSEETHLG